VEKPDASPYTPPVAQAELLRALLHSRGGRRNFVPIARGFVQQRQKGGGAGPLAAFVEARRHRALQLWLLAHALASSSPWDVALPSRIWAAALGVPDTASARVSISQNWSWLDRQQLTRSERDGALRRVYLLEESGTGTAYTHDSDSRRFDYFKLPHDYWLDGWSTRLSLRATAVLLIALSLPRTFALPQEHGARWYGISRDTIRRGLGELLTAELLTYRVTFRAAPLSPIGAIEQRRYELRSPFRRPSSRSAPPDHEPNVALDGR
jgi:hypothetical protein